MTAPDAPLLPDLGVIALVPERWTDVWQRRHHTMLQLSRYFHVVWLDPQDHWRRVMRRTQRDDYGVPPPSSLRVAPARWWHARIDRLVWWDRLTMGIRLRSARRYLRRKGCTKIALYIWRPQFFPALDQVRHDASCYHIDDEYSFSSVEQPISIEERELLERVDCVFIHSPAMLSKKGSVNPNTVYAPNGVDYEAYSAPASEPADLASIPRPRILYTGRLKRQLDWDLLLELAATEPGWQFVFVGPPAPHDVGPLMSELAGKPNVHFLGPKHPRLLPAYVQHADVCVMPYVIDAYTRYISPLKLHEYLATGKPVVTSPLESLRDFSEVLAVATGARQWRAELESALSGGANTPEQISRRQDVARRHDWERLTTPIAETIAGALGHSFAVPLRSSSGPGAA